MNKKIRRIMVFALTLCMAFGTMCLPSFGETNYYEETLPDGSKLQVTETTTVTTDPETDIITTIISKVSILKNAVEEADDDADLPDVEITLSPGNTVEKRAEGQSGDSQPDPGTDNYDYTNTLVKLWRTASATTGSISSSYQHISDLGLSGIGPVTYPEKTTVSNVGVTDGSPAPVVAARFHEGSNGKYYPILNGRTVVEYGVMPDDVKGKYTYNAETDLYVPTNEADKNNAFEPVKNGINWDYVISALCESPYVGQVKYTVDGTEKYNGVSMMCLVDKTGNRVYAYCMDAQRGTAEGVKYFVENIDNQTYIPDRPAAIEHIKACVKYGYWGTEDGIGSVEQIKQNLKDALNNGFNTSFEYNARNSEGQDKIHHSYDTTNPDQKAELLALIDDLSEGEALLATQVAIWHYANQTKSITDWEIQTYKSYSYPDDTTYPAYGENWDAHNKGEARINLLINYLLSDYLMDKSENEFKETVIIDDKHFIKDGTLKLTIKDRVDESAARDEAGSEVYMTDLSFKMDAEPTSKDELTVTLTSEDGTVSRTAHLGKDENLNDSNFTIKNGEYTFKDIPLREGIEMKFTLDVEGVQYLEHGVYIYTPVEGSSVKQTTVGLAQGKKAVDVSAGFNLQFQVISEEQQVILEHYMLSTTYERVGGGSITDGDGTGGGDGAGDGLSGDSQTNGENGNKDSAAGTGDPAEMAAYWVIAAAMLITCLALLFHRGRRKTYNK